MADISMVNWPVSQLIGIYSAGGNNQQPPLKSMLVKWHSFHPVVELFVLIICCQAVYSW